MFKCAECTLTFVDPKPSREVLFSAVGEKYALTKDTDGTSVIVESRSTGDAAVSHSKIETPDKSELKYRGANRLIRRSMVRAAMVSRYIWGKDVVDIGCGGGFMVEAMRRFRARAVGVDLNPQRIAFAARRYSKNQYFCESIEKFPDRDLTFDFVYTSRVIEHVYDVNDFMSVFARITRPGGFAYVRTPDRDDRRKARHDLASPDAPGPPVWVHYFSKPSISILLENHGFEIKRISFHMSPFMHVLARRK